MGKFVRLIESRIKLVTHRDIRRQLLAGCKCLVIRVELSCEHTQSIELRKKIAGCVARRPHRVIGMLSLPGDEQLMGRAEIQVVKHPESLIQGNRAGHAIDRWGGAACEDYCRDDK